MESQLDRKSAKVIKIKLKRGCINAAVKQTMIFDQIYKSLVQLPSIYL